MALAYFRRRAESAGLGHVLSDSAGTLGIEGAPAAPEAVQALREHDLDLSLHRSRGVSELDARTSDWIVAMTRNHLEEMARRFPDARGRQVLLRAFEERPEPVEGAPDLDDPIGLPLEYYQRVFQRIRTCVDHLILHLKHGA